MAWWRDDLPAENSRAQTAHSTPLTVLENYPGSPQILLGVAATDTTKELENRTWRPFLWAHSTRQGQWGHLDLRSL